MNSIYLVITSILLTFSILTSTKNSDLNLAQVDRNAEDLFEQGEQPKIEQQNQIFEEGESYQGEIKPREEELEENLEIRESNPDQPKIKDLPTPSIGIENETEEPSQGEVEVEF